MEPGPRSYLYIDWCMHSVPCAMVCRLMLNMRDLVVSRAFSTLPSIANDPSNHTDNYPLSPLTPPAGKTDFPTNVLDERPAACVQNPHQLHTQEEEIDGQSSYYSEHYGGAIAY